MANSTLRKAFAGDPLARVVVPGSWREDDFGAFSAQPDLSPGEDAELVEDAVFSIHNVPVSNESGFRYFLDGAERKWRVGFHGLHPIFLAHTSAGLLFRNGRTVEAPAPERYLGGQVEAYAPEDACRALIDIGLPTSPMKISEGDTSAMVEQAIRKRIQQRREQHEVALARAFENDGFLLVDGGIGKAVDSNPQLTKVVGLVKTHNKQYVKSAAAVAAVLSLTEGQRTTLFRRPNDSFQGAAVLSCYLKLRASEQQGPFFGLVRLELPDLTSSVDQIDEIASWILWERSPWSLPDPRFDRLLYPIRLVEEHLKARQPSAAAIVGIIG